MPRVNFINQRIIIDLPDGETLLDAARRAEIFVPAPCGGSGTCGKCKVRIVENPTLPTSYDESFFNEQELSQGWRLACKAVPENDVAVEYSDGHHGEVILAESAHISLKLKPDICKSGRLGLAVDLGTTTIAAALYDLSNAEPLARAATGNPQAIYGADVIARIDQASKFPNGTAVMQSLAVKAINSLLKRLVAQTQSDCDDVKNIVVAGNTTMQHFLLGENASSIAVAPFTPVFTDARELSASGLGLNVSSDAKLRVMPAISGYVGGDIVADMLAVGWADGESGENQLMIDVGTNGEIALRQGDVIWACSTAAGPAFEGAKITCGTRAIPGAINAVDAKDGLLKIDTVEEVPPSGICGTGLLDAVAALLELSAIDCGGRLVRPGDGIDRQLAKQVIPHTDGGSAVILGGDVILTARDVREFQLAKAAISAGVSVLLQNAGITPEDVDSVLLAGAMGSFLRPASAIKTGLLPAGFCESQIFAVGNTALEGAGMCLLCNEQRLSADDLSTVVKYIELSGRLDFQMAYTEAMMFL